MKIRRLIALSCWLLLLPGYRPLSGQIFLRLDGVSGSVTATNHLGWMAITSLQQGISRKIGSPGGSTNRPVAAPSFSDFTVTKPQDSGSPQLALLAAGGGSNIINSGTMELVQLGSGQAVYLRINLTNILISSYSLSGSGDVPSESLSLAPLIISWNYTSFNSTNGLPDGYQTNYWNLAASGTNSPVFTSIGRRDAGGVQLTWTAIAGHHYRIFAVADLTKPFLPVADLTASSDGVTNYAMTPTAPAMFYMVQEVPGGN